MAQPIKTLTNFGNMTDQDLLATAGGVAKGLKDNKQLPNPPVDPVVLQTGVDDFVAAIAAQVDGGLSATAAKNNKRDALIAMLRKLAAYVDHNCGGNLEVLLSSGFPAASTTRDRSPLEKPSILDIDNGSSSRLIVKSSKVDRARGYEAQTAAIGAGGTPGPWQSHGLFTNTRSMPLEGLTPGTTYIVQVRAFGGPTRYSDWSNPVTRICT